MKRKITLVGILCGVLGSSFANGQSFEESSYNQGDGQSYNEFRRSSASEFSQGETRNPESQSRFRQGGLSGRFSFANSASREEVQDVDSNFVINDQTGEKIYLTDLQSRENQLLNQARNSVNRYESDQDNYSGEQTGSVQSRRADSGRFSRQGENFAEYAQPSSRNFSQTNQRKQMISSGEPVSSAQNFAKKENANWDYAEKNARAVSSRGYVLDRQSGYENYSMEEPQPFAARNQRRQEVSFQAERNGMTQPQYEQEKFSDSRENSYRGAAYSARSVQENEGKWEKSPKSAGTEAPRAYREDWSANQGDFESQRRPKVRQNKDFRVQRKQSGGFSILSPFKSVGRMFSRITGN